jgi:hypothetical protein
MALGVYKHRILQHRPAVSDYSMVFHSQSIPAEDQEIPNYCEYDAQSNNDSNPTGEVDPTYGIQWVSDGEEEERPMETTSRTYGARGWRRGVVTFTAVMAMASGTQASAGDRPSPAAGRAPVPQAYNRMPAPAAAATVERDLRAAIRAVEQSDLACTTKNSIVLWLRAVDDNVVSGRRTAASGLLKAFLEDLRSMHESGLLTAAQREAFAAKLTTLAGRIGSGWTTKAPRPSPWPRLPACTADRGAAPGLVGGPTALTVHKITSILIKVTFKAAETVASLYGLEFPWADDGIKALISDELEADFKQQVSDTLDGLGQDLDNFVQWETCCAVGDPDIVKDMWSAAQADFVAAGPLFQDRSYQVELLPLFVQYENLYITLLREAVLFGHDWGMDTTSVDHAASLLTSSIAASRSYVNSAYQAGLDALDDPNDAQKNFELRNPYLRDMRLNVLDYSDAWPYQDPTAYSFGDAEFSLTRMIYSAPVGHAQDQFVAPTNVQYPLSTLAGWEKIEYVPGDRTDEYWLSALRTDNAPLAGLVTGDVNLSPGYDGSAAFMHQWAVSPGSSLGPIVQVDAAEWREGIFYKYIIQSLRLHFSNGSWAEASHFYDWNFSPDDVTFSYPDHVLGTAKVMGTFGWSKGDVTADSAVFGFRYSDSFYPSGAVRNASTGKCFDLQSWAAGTPVVIYTCESSEAQHWTYNSTTMELTSSGGEIDGGTRCIEASGTTVRIAECSGIADQKWAINSNGTIVNLAQSTLCLATSSAMDNSVLKLAGCDGTTAQKWTTPWTTRQAGTIQAGPGVTNVCMEVSGGSRVDGTAVETAGCNPGNWKQQWNYDSESHMVQAYGGTKCLAPKLGTSAVVIGACTGDASQQWSMGTDTIKNDQSGLCLYRSSTVAGIALQLATCSSADAGQKWHWPLR